MEYVMNAFNITTKTSQKYLVQVNNEEEKFDCKLYDEYVITLRNKGKYDGDNGNDMTDEQERLFDSLKNALTLSFTAKGCVEE